jgi:hypothetical protein
VDRLLEFQQIKLIPKLQLILDQEKCEIDMRNEDFIRDITILMTDQDIQLKFNTLIIRNLACTQVHIYDWLLFYSPNLKDLQIRYPSFNPNFDRCLEI